MRFSCRIKAYAIHFIQSSQEQPETPRSSQQQPEAAKWNRYRESTKNRLTNDTTAQGSHKSRNVNKIKPLQAEQQTQQTKNNKKRNKRIALLQGEQTRKTLHGEQQQKHTTVTGRAKQKEK